MKQGGHLKRFFCFVVSTALSVSALAADSPRARDLGIPFEGTPGEYNAITDVAGVTVGFETLIEDLADEKAVRTGVTSIAAPDSADSTCVGQVATLNTLFNQCLPPPGAAQTAPNKVGCITSLNLIGNDDTDFAASTASCPFTAYVLSSAIDQYRASVGIIAAPLEIGCSSGGGGLLTIPTADKTAIVQVKICQLLKANKPRKTSARVSRSQVLCFASVCWGLVSSAS